MQYFLELRSTVRTSSYVPNLNTVHWTLSAYMRRTRQSAPEYSLLQKKLPLLIKKNLTPPNLGPKKTGLIIAFRIAWTLDVKIVWFGHQVAVCVQKWHKNAIFGCSWFQKFNFDFLLLKLLIYSPTTENIFIFVCPLLTQSSIMIPQI